MKHIRQGSRSDLVKDFALGKAYMQCALTEGQLESTESKAEETLSAFGRLIQVLADNGTLDLKDINYVVLGYKNADTTMEER
jgi:hypothetical protein